MNRREFLTKSTMLTTFLALPMNQGIKYLEEQNAERDKPKPLPQTEEVLGLTAEQCFLMALHPEVYKDIPLDVKTKGIFYSLLATAYKFPKEEASGMADSCWNMIVDMSDDTGYPRERVAQNIISGLIGNTRALYPYGISVTHETIKQRAYQMFIAPKGSELNKQQKMLSVFTILVAHCDRLDEKNEQKKLL